MWSAGKDGRLARRDVLRYAAAASAGALMTGLAGCRRAPEAQTPVLHADGFHDDSAALSHLLAGREVVYRGALHQFDRKPPAAAYFLARTVEAPAGAVITGCVFYARCRPAIIVRRGAIFNSCWTCLSPNPLVTGQFSAAEGVSRQ